MQQGGFLNQHSRNPAGLMAVAALHGAAISALILFPPKFIIPERLPTFIVDSIPDKAPPPPVAEAPPPKTAEQAVTRPDPIVSSTTPVQTVDLTKTPLVDPVIIEPPVILPEPVKPAPVLTEARVDPRGVFQPDYPPRLARQDIEGSAVVRVLIGADGQVKTVELVSATDPAFFEATRKQALRHWRFKPATRDGTAVESWRTMTVRFEMKA